MGGNNDNFWFNASRVSYNYYNFIKWGKIMYNLKYSQVIMFIVIMYINLSNLVEGYKLGYIGISSIVAFCIVTLLIFIWGYRKNKYRSGYCNYRRVIDLVIRCNNNHK